MKFNERSAADRAKIDAIRQAHYAREAGDTVSEDAIASRVRPVAEDHKHADPAPKPVSKAKAKAKAAD